VGLLSHLVDRVYSIVLAVFAEVQLSPRRPARRPRGRDPVTRGTGDPYGSQRPDSPAEANHHARRRICRVVGTSPRSSSARYRRIR